MSNEINHPTLPTANRSMITTEEDRKDIIEKAT